MLKKLGGKCSFLQRSEQATECEKFGMGGNLKVFKFGQICSRKLHRAHGRDNAGQEEARFF